MSSKLEKEKQKQIQERCQRLLNQMLKDEDNKYCVDCDAKGPRWASWNLGIFLCIRCAGIHRNLGVHISKVKSVNLDTWTPQQIVSLQQMGNSRARAVYEANLPDNFRRPQTDSSLESFIRAKYEHKKYIAHEWVQPPILKVNWDKEIEEEIERQKKKKRESKTGVSSSTSVRPLSTPPVVLQPLPKPSVTSSPKPARSSQYTDLLGLDTPPKESPSGSKKTSSDSDLFSGFLNSSPSNNVSTSPSLKQTTASTLEMVSSSSVSNITSRTDEEDSFFNQSQQNVSTSNKQKQLTKDSILALYGNPGAYTPPMNNSVPQAYNSQLLNGMAGAYPSQINQMQPGLQNGVMHGNMSFSNVNMNAAPNMFASNPFYSVGAPAPQINAAFPASKTSSTASASTSTLPLDTNSKGDKQSQLPQQMATLNLNMSNTNYNPSNMQGFTTSNFLGNPSQPKNGFVHPQSQNAFGHTITAANQWQ